MRRRALLVLDRYDSPEQVLPALRLHADEAPLDLVILQVLPDWCMRRLETAARVDLQNLAARWASDRLHVVADLRRGEPVHEILAAVREHGADLVLMPPHEEDLVDRLLHQTPLDLVRRAAPVPVLQLTDAAPARAS
jgi:nucleotide-binding universal stress UspA family protein